jgi:hypothetical protein
VPTNKNQRPFGSALAAISAGHSLLLQTDLFRRRRERFVIAVLSAAMAKNLLFACSVARAKRAVDILQAFFVRTKA